MSGTEHSHLHLNQTRREHHPEEDPTNTTAIRNRYEDALVDWFEELATVIDPDDSDDGIERNQVEPIPQVFRFEHIDDSRRIDAFLEWLKRQERMGVFQIIQRDGNYYIRHTYEDGIRHAEEALQGQGVDTDTLRNIFALPVHRDVLQRLFTRNFEELEGITAEMNRQIARELTRGFGQGLGPEQIARNIRNVVDDIGVNRSRLLARTEVINAHSEATLNRYESVGVREVTVKAEIRTAGDQRVCPVCIAIAAGGPYETETIRSGTFRYDPDDDAEAPPNLLGDYPYKPPIHPNCRCSLLPYV